MYCACACDNILWNATLLRSFKFASATTTILILYRVVINALRFSYNIPLSRLPYLLFTPSPLLHTPTPLAKKSLFTMHMFTLCEDFCMCETTNPNTKNERKEKMK